MAEDILTQQSPFLALYADLKKEEEFYEKKPLLAHYTSLSNLESIFKHDEVWLSNPLFMNDFEEVRFGVIEGLEQIKASKNLRTSLLVDSNYDTFIRHYYSFFSLFAEEHVIDTYVFCLSLHDQSDNDGKLSMWRGYGASGNGACIVLDSSKVLVLENSPFILARVHYATRQERREKIVSYVDQLSVIISTLQQSDEQIRLAAYYLFERIKLFALFTKHSGFTEEDEWRIVYLPDRDLKKMIYPMIDYWIGPKGIEPKLKLALKEIPFGEKGAFSLKKITDRIIVGPSTSSPMALKMVQKMLKKNSCDDLCNRVVASTIPFRNQ